MALLSYSKFSVGPTTRNFFHIELWKTAIFRHRMKAAIPLQLTTYNRRNMCLEGILVPSSAAMNSFNCATSGKVIVWTPAACTHAYVPLLPGHWNVQNVYVLALKRTRQTNITKVGVQAEREKSGTLRGSLLQNFNQIKTPFETCQIQNYTYGRLVLDSA